MTQLLRPGLLVALKTSIRGGIVYQRDELEPDHREGDARICEWKTRREISDAAEYDKAVIARSAARNAIVRVCRLSSFGLLCPVDDEQKLADAVMEARQIANIHNNDANVTKVEVFVLTGRIAQTDEEAARAIGNEVKELIARMERGVATADPEAIRAAATEAKQLASMLSDEAQTKVSEAIAQVRKAASELVKRVEKAGEKAADVVKEIQLDKLHAARFAVLDLMGEGEEAEGVKVPVAAPGIDLTPEAIDSAKTTLGSAGFTPTEIEL
jgi:hypothetical protein